MNRENIIDMIKSSSERSVKQVGEYYLTGNTKMFVTDPLPDNIDIDDIKIFLKTKIPHRFVSLVDVVYVGQFAHLKDRNINAAYMDGALYITNEQDNFKDMIDDIVHEIAHAVEQHNTDLIYGDERLMVEFLGKRKRLFNLLKSKGFNVKLKEFLQVNYNYEFDMFLFQEIGYPLLNNLVIGLFPGAYSVTSLSEYFATGFERFYMREGKALSKTCPVLIKKIDYLDELANEY